MRSNRRNSLSGRASVRAPDYDPARRSNCLTPYYDAVGGTTRVRVFKEVPIRQADIKAEHCAFELASGTGTFAISDKQSQLLATVTRTGGEDAIVSMTIRKRKGAKVAVQFDHGLCCSLPYLDADFDRALSSSFFQHLTKLSSQRTAQEFVGVRRPGAQLDLPKWGCPDAPLKCGLFLSIRLLHDVVNTQENASGKRPAQSCIGVRISRAGLSEVATNPLNEDWSSS